MKKKKSYKCWKEVEKKKKIEVEEKKETNS
jgi:hypothetical protein